MNFVLIYFIWWRWHNGYNILYDKRFSVFCLFLFITDRCCMGQYLFLFMSGNCIGIFFGKMAPFTAIMDAIHLWFSVIDKALLHASEHSLADKIEERITFDLSHARLYLAKSDDEWDDKSAAANTFNVSCGVGGSSPSLSATNIYLSATSDVVCCWIFMSDRFLPNYLLSSDDTVDWYNASMLGIGSVDTNIDEGSFVLHNSR